MQYGVFTCEQCGGAWPEELPPLWSAFDLWPRCCARAAFLQVVLIPLPGQWNGISELFKLLT